jgi:Holliday junction resolvase RusA-like endonuclease
MGYMSAEGKKAKKRFQEEMNSQWQSDVLLGDIKVTAVYFWGDRRRRDIDNFSKLWMDAGTGIIWEDDSQIKQLLLRMKYCVSNPRVELKVEIKKDDSI